MDYQLDKVIRDKVSDFATISLVLSAIHASPLSDLGVTSLQFEVAFSGDLTTSASLDPSTVTIE